MTKDGVEEIPNRTGESGSVPFRSGRLINSGPFWYYSTREGNEAGPFNSRELAEASLKSYLNDIDASSE